MTNIWMACIFRGSTVYLFAGSAAKKNHMMAQFFVTGGVSNKRVVRAFGIMQLSTTLSLKRIGCLKVLLFQHLQGAKENNRTFFRFDRVGVCVTIRELGLLGFRDFRVGFRVYAVEAIVFTAKSLLFRV